MKIGHVRRTKLNPPPPRSGGEGEPLVSKAGEIGRELEARLRRMRLHLESPDHDTLAIKRVPASPRSYNKPRTNLLIKRSAAGGKCFVCVDDNLEYLGADPALSAAFASGSLQQGWRILPFGGWLRGDLAQALEYALGILGCDDSVQQAPAPGMAGRSLLANCATNLTQSVRECPARPTLFRDEELEQAASCVLTWKRRLQLIVGQPGAGKSNLLAGVAWIVNAHGYSLFSVNLGALMAGKLFDSERELLLSSLLRAASEANAVLALEHAACTVAELPRAGVLLRDALDRGTRLIATATPEQASSFTGEPVGSALEVVHLAEFCASDTLRVLELLRPSLSKHHGVEIGADAEQAAVERSQPLGGVFPGKAVRLLDLAVARAKLNRCAAVQPIDVYLAASRLPEAAM